MIRGSWLEPIELKRQCEFVPLSLLKIWRFILSYTFTSLTAATSTGPGTSVDLLGVSNDLTIQVNTTGTPDDCRVQIQGSLDGTNWLPVLTFTVYTPGNVAALPSGSPKMRHYRANVQVLSGGTSPTVTAIIYVGDVH